ncbi:MAG: copper homeostasis protein CutC [Candidatus Pseudobacter hemicellulosilyticus]|uniref:PF03932 family protein CutC n=1 Tax=Candidatus Pseudobacter hemicellulosilyticus TaxID=3121375 RepID=A0AAJ5WSL5_9BACT|nr:MAG: copper homeostasis protein CutC [Pseudobacter sp.]
MPTPILEVCAYNLPSALVAQHAGAARIELCDSAAEGGTTPSYGALVTAREKLHIPLYPIIRPRAGNFWYNAQELDIMKKDILLCKTLGCEGISTGVQLQNGKLDVDAMKRIAEWAYPMGLTCHRVFDVTPDPFEALEQLIDAGYERVLSSGQQRTAPEGTGLLARLVRAANDRIAIMPGAGIRAANIENLVRETGAKEFHASARKPIPDAVTYLNPAVSGDYGAAWLANEAELRSILAVLNAQEAAVQ